MEKCHFRPMDPKTVQYEGGKTLIKYPAARRP
jgi:hypothetical protein